MNQVTNGDDNALLIAKKEVKGTGDDQRENGGAGDAGGAISGSNVDKCAQKDTKVPPLAQ